MVQNNDQKRNIKYYACLHSIADQNNDPLALGQQQLFFFNSLSFLFSYFFVVFVVFVDFVVFFVFVVFVVFFFSNMYSSARLNKQKFYHIISINHW
ncbi:hypothetical protein BZA77DRAFT_25101 [Pyronema omphalodes]|nr:hypothetical protein BZA77DRAFT_25101 [Pyronema omphalodes]